MGFCLALGKILIFQENQSSNCIQSSRNQSCSIKKDVLENFAKWTGKHLCQNHFIRKRLWQSTCVLLWILPNFQEHIFHRIALNDCSFFSHKCWEFFKVKWKCRNLKVTERCFPEDFAKFSRILFYRTALETAHFLVISVQSSSKCNGSEEISKWKEEKYLLVF